jgi:hypothetical protein
LGCDAHFIKRLLAILLLFAVLSSGAAYADERVGTWNVVTVRTYGKEKVTGKATGKIWSLKNGTLRSTSTGRWNGLRVKSEGWSYNNGTSESFTYVNGELTEFSEGTWKKSGNRMLFTDVFEGLNGSGKTEGYSRRINRNKFISYAEVRVDGLSGKIRQTSTYTRIRK